MSNYIKLIRVKHWIKNFLIFIPLICSKMVNEINIINVFLGFFSFSLLSSFIYIVNDIRDIQKDRMHPTKKNRPLASGKVKKSTAIFIAIILFIGSIVINSCIHMSFLNVSLYFLLAYFLINIFYSFGLKNIAIIDVALLTSGFVIRVYYGASIIGVEVSDWLFLTIMNASLFLGLGKRKKEIQTSKTTRNVLKYYNESFLDKFQYVALGLAIVFYSLWAIEQEIQLMYLTIPLIIMIFMRYCLIIESSDEGDPTTILYKDKSLILLVIIYGLSMLYLLGVI